MLPIALASSQSKKEMHTIAQGLYALREFVHHKKRRYYRVLVGSDLLGDMLLITCWGSLDSKRGHYQQHLLSASDIPTLLAQITTKRQQRHYQQL